MTLPYINLALNILCIVTILLNRIAINQLLKAIGEIAEIVNKLAKKLRS